MGERPRLVAALGAEARGFFPPTNGLGNCKRPPVAGKEAMQLETTQEETGFLRSTSGPPDSSSPDDHDKLGHALVLVVDKLDGFAAWHPKHGLAFATDPQQLAFHALR